MQNIDSGKNLPRLAILWKNFILIFKSNKSFSHFHLISLFLSVCLSVNFSYFQILFQNHWANLKQIWREHPWVEGMIKFVQTKGHAFLPRGDNSENVKLYWKYLKIFYSWTIWPFSTKLGTKHPWIEGIQFSSNAGSCLSPRGDKSEIVNVYSKYFKIFFPEPPGQFEPNLAQSILR